jgi:hypothetical protein
MAGLGAGVRHGIDVPVRLMIEPRFERSLSATVHRPGVRATTSHLPEDSASVAWIGVVSMLRICKMTLEFRLKIMTRLRIRESVQRVCFRYLRPQDNIAETSEEH